MKSFIPQNWARSAFLYEYRCRKKRGKETSWFGVPWVTLNNVQRGVLRTSWPPLTTGPATIVRPVHPSVSEFGKLQTFTLQIPVELSTMTDGQILECVKGKLDTERGRRNSPRFGKGEGKVQMSHRWCVLEEMDEAFYKNQTLGDATRTAKSKVETEYLKACKDAGIEA